jgi:hypothetical protein
MKKRGQKIFFSIAVGLCVLIAFWYSLFFLNFTSPSGNVFGVSFASGQAEYLGLDPKEVYLSILDDLGVRQIRISVYWNRVEKKKDVYDFSELDWQMNEAAKRGAGVILAVGRRVPRWPECHSPDWVGQLSEKEEEQALLDYLTQLAIRYRRHPALRIWQVENEVFLNLFGKCPRYNKSLFLEETALIRSLDPSHPIMITDSGEFGSWLRGREVRDYLGTSIYRVVAEWWSGYVKYGYFIPPAFYRIKAKLVGQPVDKVIVSELQAEPWTPKELLQTPIKEQYRSMSIEQFNKNVEFARRTGFRDIYLWGVEWWYWMKKQGEPAFWNQARKLFKETAQSEK